jgi:regulator of sirC expression with transglutaminase-like and TPR domain
VDGLARAVASRLEDDPGPLAAVRALNGLLFDEEGFRGNLEDYYDPRNSFLNDVLDRRTGIPITLSTVYIEVGRRAGLSVEWSTPSMAAPSSRRTTARSASTASTAGG